MKTVILTTYKRAGYLNQVLEALSQCFGIEEYTILFSCDVDERYRAECQAVVNRVHEWKGPKQVYVHEPRLGIDVNKFFIWKKAFELSDYAIHLEDDCVPAKDFLRYHEWASEKFRDEQKVMAVSAYQNDPLSFDVITPTMKRVRGMYNAYRGTGFNCWGWGTWKGRWETVIGDERAYRGYAGNQVNGRFDWWWKKWNDDHGTNQVCPFVARVQNLVGLDGENLGVNSLDEFAHKNHNPHGAWELEKLPDPNPGVWNINP